MIMIIAKGKKELALDAWKKLGVGLAAESWRLSFAFLSGFTFTSHIERE